MDLRALDNPAPAAPRLPDLPVPTQDTTSLAPRASLEGLLHVMLASAGSEPLVGGLAAEEKEGREEEGLESASAPREEGDPRVPRLMASGTAALDAAATPPEAARLPLDGNQAGRPGQRQDVSGAGGAVERVVAVGAVAPAERIEQKEVTVKVESNGDGGMGVEAQGSSQVHGVRRSIRNSKSLYRTASGPAPASGSTSAIASSASTSPSKTAALNSTKTKTSASIRRVSIKRELEEDGEEYTEHDRKKNSFRKRIQGPRNRRVPEGKVLFDGPGLRKARYVQPRMVLLEDVKNTEIYHIIMDRLANTIAKEDEVTGLYRERAEMQRQRLLDENEHWGYVLESDGRPGPCAHCQEVGFECVVPLKHNPKVRGEGEWTVAAICIGCKLSIKCSLTHPRRGDTPHGSAKPAKKGGKPAKKRARKSWEQDEDEEDEEESESDSSDGELESEGGNEQGSRAGGSASGSGSGSGSGSNGDSRAGSSTHRGANAVAASRMNPGTESCSHRGSASGASSSRSGLQEHHPGGALGTGTSASSSAGHESGPSVPAPAPALGAALQQPVKWLGRASPGGVSLQANRAKGLAGVERFIEEMQRREEEGGTMDYATKLMFSRVRRDVTRLRD